MSKYSIKAAVLCGGLGKRLRPLTYYFQKTMIPIGKRQKPLLEYIIRLLKLHNIRDIILLVGYKAEQIINYFEDGSRFGVKITYVRDDPKYKGTAGALYNAFIKGYLNADDILVYYGDILSNINLTEMINEHRKKGAILTLALSKGYRIRVGVAHLDENGRVLRFEEKPKIDLPVSIGVLVINKRAFKYLSEIVRSHKTPDIMSHFVPLLIDHNEYVNAYITNAFWYDVGSIERYEKLDELLDIIEKEFEVILNS